MTRATMLVVAVVAVEHVLFGVLEMFLWTRPIGMQVFHTTPDVAAASAVLAANQGLYNWFLAVGLAWGLWTGRREVQAFFLGCVTVAGVFGGVTADPGILVVQALPAAVGLVLVALSRAEP